MSRLQITWSRALDVAAIAVVVVAALVFGGAAMRHFARTPADRSLAELKHGNTTGDLSPENFFDLASSGSWIGPHNAPVVILVYSDYWCHFCAELQGSLDTLRVRYPEMLAIVVKQFVEPVSEGGVRARVAMAAKCASDEGRFAQFHDLVFTELGAFDSPGGVRRVAKDAGIADLPAFERCVNSQEMRGRVIEDYEEGKRLHVEKVPTWFVNGMRLTGAMPSDVIDSIVSARFPSESRVGQ